MEIDRAPLTVEAPARWPGRVRELAALSGKPMPAAARDENLAELWNLLNLALHRYVRAYAWRFPKIGPDEILDITADKALEMIGSLRARHWNPRDATDAQICAFVAAVARHGVIDSARRLARERVAAEGTHPAERGGDDDPEVSLDASRYASAIVECAGRLTARARLAWYLRVFHDFSAAQIARHPRVVTSSSGVALMLHRSRRRLRECLESKGLDPGRLPPGTFVALWEVIDAERRGAATQNEPAT